MFKSFKKNLEYCYFKKIVRNFSVHTFCFIFTNTPKQLLKKFPQQKHDGSAARCYWQHRLLPPHPPPEERQFGGVHGGLAPHSCVAAGPRVHLPGGTWLLPWQHQGRQRAADEVESPPPRQIGRPRRHHLLQTSLSFLFENCEQ